MFSIQGYPTIVVLNPSGIPIGQLGYRQGGAIAWLAELDKVITKK